MSFFKRLFGRKQDKKTDSLHPMESSDRTAQRNTTTKPDVGRPERRIFDYSTGSVESFYGQMSRDLVALHGSLTRVEYLEHFPVFRIRFTYEDGTIILSDERTGQYDIHFLSLGYVGEGPRYAKAFLSAAGFDLSTNEIKKTKPGDVITSDSATEERFASPDASQFPASQVSESVRVQFGAIEQLLDGVLSKSPPILSPDGSFVAILRAGSPAGATIDLLDAETHSSRWSVQLPSPDCEAAFIAADRILVLVGRSETQSTIHLLNAADGSILDEAEAPALTHSGTRMGWVGGKRVHTDPSRNLAVREFEDEQILRIRVENDALEISTTEVSQVFAEGPRIGSDGQCYFISLFSLYRLNDAGQEKVFGAEVNHCICSDLQGRIFCGSGYDDMSGESYLHVVDTRAMESRSVLLGREPIHRLNIAGDDQVLASSIVDRSQFRNRHHAYVAALDLSERKSRMLWEQRIEDLKWGRAPVVLTVPDESWGLIQTGEKLLLRALDTGDVLGDLRKEADEVILGAWAPSRRRIYLARFPDWEGSGRLESIEIGPQ